MTGERMPERTIDVLIADDNFASRQWLVRLLNQYAKVRLREVRDGREAVLEFARRPAEITFLDIDMPEMNGMEALGEIRQHHPSAFIVMVSALSALDKVQAALAHGVNGFIVKPYSAQRIVDILGRYAAASASPPAAAQGSNSTTN